MTDPRDDVPLADLEEQQRELDAEADLDEELPGRAPRPLSAVEANEADVLEQSLPVTGNEDDYPRGTEEEE